MNSAFANERDIGAFLLWAPQKTRALFSSLVSEGLKGSGDYGVISLSLFNGQTANRPEQNNSLHVAARISSPLTLGNQVIEPGLQAYSGKYVVTPDQLSAGTKVTASRNYLDERVAASFVLYPKPFGVQAEYNVGRGPEFNKVTDSIETKSLGGGYVTLSYLLKRGGALLYPFARYQYYDGGKKHELDARSYTVKETEVGLEWQPIKNLEFVAMYTFSRRRFEDLHNQNNLQKGRLLRLQAQVNF
jgi:hypothetical protein